MTDLLSPGSEDTWPAPRFLPLGEAALTVELGPAYTPEINARVDALARALTSPDAAAVSAGFIEVLPTLRSLTIFFDCLVTDHDAVRALAQAALKRIEKAQPGPETQREVQGEAREGGRTWCVPVCYEQSEFAPDLGAVAATLGLSPQEVVARHTSVTLRVLMVGFLPGLPYLGPVDPTLVRPRRAAPRTHVPALSVGLAAGMSVIYPRASPGGWHLIGRMPVPIFDLNHDPPGVFAAGDRVTFRAVSMAKHQELADRAAAGEPGAAVLADFAQDEAVA